MEKVRAKIPGAQALNPDEPWSGWQRLYLYCLEPDREGAETCADACGERRGAGRERVIAEVMACGEMKPLIIASGEQNLELTRTQITDQLVRMMFRDELDKLESFRQMESSATSNRKKKQMGRQAKEIQDQKAKIEALIKRKIAMLLAISKIRALPLYVPPASSLLETASSLLENASSLSETVSSGLQTASSGLQTAPSGS